MSHGAGGSLDLPAHPSQETDRGHRLLRPGTRWPAGARTCLVPCAASAAVGHFIFSSSWKDARLLPLRAEHRPRRRRGEPRGPQARDLQPHELGRRAARPAGTAAS